MYCHDSVVVGKNGPAHESMKQFLPPMKEDLAVKGGPGITKQKIAICFRNGHLELFLK